MTRYLDENSGKQIVIETNKKFATVESSLSDIPNQTFVTEKAKTVDVNNALELKRDKSTLITTNDIDKSADAKKIHLLDLAEEVQSAMAGTAPVISTVADGSITLEKYSNGSIVPTKINENIVVDTNRFNKDTITDNKIVVSTTGGLEVHTSFAVTDYIPIENGKTYTIPFGKISELLAFYDSSKQYISGIAGATNDGAITPYTFTVSVTNAKYMRVNIQKSLTPVSTYMVREGTSLPSIYEPYATTKYKLPWLLTNLNNVDKDSALSPSNIENVEVIIGNKFDSATIIDNQVVINTTGALSSNTSFAVTDYIPIENGKTYTIPFGKIETLLAFYDSSKQYVSGIAGATNDGVIVPYTFTVTNSNVAYVRINIQKSLTPVSTYMVVEDTELPITYRPYSITKYKLPWIYVDEENVNPTIMEGREIPIQRFKGKNLLVSGDSITEINYRADKHWHEYLTDYLGLGTVYNHAVSGTGLSKDSGASTNDSFFKRFGLLDNYPTPDFILYMGNMNDGSGTNPGRIYNIGTFENEIYDVENPELYATLHKFCKDMITKYPLTPIGFIISTPRYTEWGNTCYFEEWSQAIIKVCNHYSIPVLDLYHNSGLRPWVAENNLEYFSSTTSPSGDGVHPNIKGQELMALKTYEFVKQYL